MEKWTSYWESICEIYFLTKYYLLLAEELSDGFGTFLQPVKEHRDAFDHIARVYGYKFQKSSLVINDVEAYKDTNMRKAVGHTYRAFFDTADFLSYVCRKHIRVLLDGKSSEEILEKYPEYKEVREFLINLPERIAAVRGNKDVSDNMSDLINEVKDYREILDHLLKIYKDIQRIFQ